MDKELDELIEDGREDIQQLLSIIEEHIHHDDFSFEEQEDYWYFKTFYRKVSKVTQIKFYLRSELWQQMNTQKYL